MDLQLAGAPVLVLGATRGIGRAIADSFVAEGARVAICARNAEAVDETVAALCASAGDDRAALGWAADVTDADAVGALVARAAEALGGLQVVIANASAMSMGGSVDAFDKAVDLDLKSTVNVAGASMDHLEKAAAERGDASFLSICSISAAQAREPSAYGAIKAALIHYVKGLATQAAAKGVRANTLSPGTVWFENGVWHLVEQHAPDVYKDALERNPLKRMATPQEIANTAVFMCSPLSTFTTGSNVIVDGGMLPRVNF